MARSIWTAITTTNTVDNGEHYISVRSPSDVFGISDEAILIYTWIVYSIVSQLICFFGIVANIVNIICFIKQGFKDSINISLLGLSISDMCVLIPLTWANVLVNPTFIATDLPFDPVGVCYLIAAMPYLTFSRVSSWVTAIITLERCLCVIFPLKIKTIFTPRRTTLIISSIFMLTVSCVAPTYVVNRLDMKFSPRHNKTLVGIMSRTDRETVEQLSLIINNFVIAFLSFIFITICAITIAIKLHTATKWRKESTSVPKVGNVSDRNQRVSKMVLVVSILFIVCSSPSCIAMLAVAFEPGLYFNDSFINIGFILGGFSVLLQSVNSSGNILIYFNMSSKYRYTLLAIFCTQKRDC